MADSAPQRKRELQKPLDPLITWEDGEPKVSYLTIRKTLQKSRNSSPRVSHIYKIVRIANLLNRQNIIRVYRDKDEILPKDYDIISELAGLWWDQMDHIPEDSDGKDYANRRNAISFGRSLAAAFQVFLHKTYDSARRTPGKGSAKNLVGQLVRFEEMYDLWLNDARKAARTGDTVLIREVFDIVQLEGYGEFALLVEKVGALMWEKRGYKAVGLRISQLTRKMALLLASAVYLRVKMVTASSRRGLQKVAKSRKRLRRHVPNVKLTLKGLKGLKKYTRVPISAYVSEIQWVALSSKSYSFAKEVNGNFEVRLYYKNMRRSGISTDTWIWVKGKKEGTDSAPRIVSELEGPGQHRQTYWEDYLADAVREAYDLYPGSLHMEWEFPVVGRKGAINDIVSRIKK